MKFTTTLLLLLFIGNPLFADLFCGSGKFGHYTDWMFAGQDDQQITFILVENKTKMTEFTKEILEKDHEEVRSIFIQFDKEDCTIENVDSNNVTEMHHCKNKSDLDVFFTNFVVNNTGAPKLPFTLNPDSIVVKKTMERVEMYTTITRNINVFSLAKGNISRADTVQSILWLNEDLEDRKVSTKRLASSNYSTYGWCK